MDRGAWWATVHGVAKESDMTDAHTPGIFYYLFAAVIAIKSYAVLTTLLTPSIVPDTS